MRTWSSICLITCWSSYLWEGFITTWTILCSCNRWGIWWSYGWSSYWREFRFVRRGVGWRAGVIGVFLLLRLWWTIRGSYCYELIDCLFLNDVCFFKLILIKYFFCCSWWYSKYYFSKDYFDYDTKKGC